MADGQRFAAVIENLGLDLFGGAALLLRLRRETQESEVEMMNGDERGMT